MGTPYSTGGPPWGYIVIPVFPLFSEHSPPSPFTSSFFYRAVSSSRIQVGANFHGRVVGDASRVLKDRRDQAWVPRTVRLSAEELRSSSSSSLLFGTFPSISVDTLIFFRAVPSPRTERGTYFHGRFVGDASWDP